MNEAVCKSCGAAILFAVTERGRRMPLSKASERRRFILDGDLCRSVVTYEAHWADCPTADQHQKEPA